jgi:hypothetical protein
MWKTPDEFGLPSTGEAQQFVFDRADDRASEYARALDQDWSVPDVVREDVWQRTIEDPRWYTEWSEVLEVVGDEAAQVWFFGALDAYVEGGAKGASQFRQRSGSRSIEDELERPRILFDLWPDWQRKAMRDAVNAYTAEKAKMQATGMPIPPQMLKRFALRRYASEVARRSGGGRSTMIDYLVAGENSFVVGPELQAMLLNTGLGQVKRWMLKPPYSTFYIALPESELRIWGAESQLAPVRGLVVDFDYQRGVMGVLVWAPLERLRPVVERMHNRPLPARLTDAELSKTFGWLGNDSYMLMDLDEAFAHPGGLEGYINASFLEAAEGFGWPRAALETTLASRVEALKLAIGTILYLQSDKAEMSVDAIMSRAQSRRGELQAKLARTKATKKRRRIERELDQIPSGPIVTWLGKSIEQAARQQFQMQQAPTSGRRPMRRHWVRGHWKVPYAKHKRREIAWIAPYERGKGKRVTGRTYKLREDS